jgi:prepilin-type N-terminal cleavage/methylation domain-containing protein
MNRQFQHGFTLIEMAIVLLILAALLSYTFMPLRAQLETANIKEARGKLAEIEQAIYGFAIANGRMPCPTLPGQGGLSVPQNPTPPNASCNSSIGFVPSVSLGLKGETNCDGLLLDPWGRPYRYSVTDDDSGDGDGNDDFVVSNELRDVGVANAGPDLRVCRNLDAACLAGAGTAPEDRIADNVVAVIFSMGTKSRANSAAEDENAGEGGTLASTCGLAAYPIGNDRFYYAAQRREIAGQEFDDQLIWISPSILYGKLLQAGQIP